ncbi:MAG TPA: cobalt transporter [Candidatus Merdisoma merdipullorum]|nr:cobalt transporter [Candidatus Merdisoma merdipullorum]
MHIVDGEHGHAHGHDHEHTHAHDHAHEHEHCGGCGGCEGKKPGSEQEALLSYMLDHNKHHAAELADVAKKFRETGKEDVAVQIEKAIENFDKGNLYLSLALSLVK